MMIQVIENHSQHFLRNTVEGMFIDRKSLFVDLLGWDVPVIDGRFEMDEFDRSDAVYLVATANDGSHEASLRLMPSIKPHMLGALFPHLCPGGVPVDEHIWESSRLCLPQRHGAAKRLALRRLLISAMVDFGLDRNIRSFTGILPEAFRKEVLAMGWQAEPLGPAVAMLGGKVGAFAVQIRTDTPARLGWTGTYVDASCEMKA